VVRNLIAIWWFVLRLNHQQILVMRAKIRNVVSAILLNINHTFA
jgi:hypothetical protein